MKKNILFVVALVVIVACLVACNSIGVAEPAASETALSSEAASEEAPEEVTENASEKEIDLSTFSRRNNKRPIDLVRTVIDMNYDELKIVVWANNKADAILSDGDSYVLDSEASYCNYTLVSSKPVQTFKVNNETFHQGMSSEYYFEFSPWISNEGIIEEDAFDIICEVVYKNGVTETLTVDFSLGEVSENVTENAAEPEPEIIDAVQKFSFESEDKMYYFSKSVQNTAVLAGSLYYDDFSLLYDGAHYTIPINCGLSIASSKEIVSVTTSSNGGNIWFYDSVFDDNIGKVWWIYLDDTYSDLELPISISYEDGSTETLTIYVTKKWKREI